MGCRPGNPSPIITPLATDPIFYKFRDSWMKMKLLNDTKPYNPDDETRKYIRSREEFYLKNKSNFNIF